MIELHPYIWNHHEKCIRISTNMPSIGLVICEIGFEIFRILRKLSETNDDGTVLRVLLTLTMRQARADDKISKMSQHF